MVCKYVNLIEISLYFVLKTDFYPNFIASKYLGIFRRLVEPLHENANPTPGNPILRFFQGNIFFWPILEPPENRTKKSFEKLMAKIWNI